MAVRATGSILGNIRTGPRRSVSRMELLEQGDKGVSKDALLRLADQLSFSVSQMAELLPLSARTIQRYRRSQRFDRAVSEQILHIAEVAARGTETFGNRDKFLLWLRAPCAAFGNQPPISILVSRFGAEMILDELGRIEHGVVS